MHLKKNSKWLQKLFNSLYEINLLIIKSQKNAILEALYLNFLYNYFNLSKSNF